MFNKSLKDIFSLEEIVPNARVINNNTFEALSHFPFITRALTTCFSSIPDYDEQESPKIKKLDKNIVFTRCHMFDSDLTDNINNPVLNLYYDNGIWEVFSEEDKHGYAASLPTAKLTSPCYYIGGIDNQWIEGGSPRTASEVTPIYCDMYFSRLNPTFSKYLENLEKRLKNITLDEIVEPHKVILREIGSKLKDTDIDKMCEKFYLNHKEKALEIIKNILYGSFPIRLTKNRIYRDMDGILFFWTTDPPMVEEVIESLNKEEQKNFVDLMQKKYRNELYGNRWIDLATIAKLGIYGIGEITYLLTPPDKFKEEVLDPLEIYHKLIGETYLSERDFEIKLKSLTNNSKSEGELSGDYDNKISMLKERMEISRKAATIYAWAYNIQEAARTLIFNNYQNPKKGLCSDIGDVHLAVEEYIKWEELSDAFNYGRSVWHYKCITGKTPPIPEYLYFHKNDKNYETQCIFDDLRRGCEDIMKAANTLYDCTRKSKIEEIKMVIAEEKCLPPRCSLKNEIPMDSELFKEIFKAYKNGAHGFDFTQELLSGWDATDSSQMKKVFQEKLSLNEKQQQEQREKLVDTFLDNIFKQYELTAPL